MRRKHWEYILDELRARSPDGYRARIYFGGSEIISDGQISLVANDKWVRVELPNNRLALIELRSVIGIEIIKDKL